MRRAWQMAGMISSRNVRFLTLGTLACVASLSVGGSMMVACSDSESQGSDGGITVEGGGKDGSTPQTGNGDGSAEQDASGKDAAADAPRDANVRDANGEGGAGGICTFNYECQAGLRCECSEATGCECKAGARGTGRNGVDPCTSGNDCQSSVCVEGPPSTGSFCSDECNTSADCTDKLPVCTSIAFVGRICTRTPPP